MKIIHAADIHLGSKLNSTFTKDVSDAIRSSVSKTFSDLADYAKDNGVKVIMLSGDVFDSDAPSKACKDDFYSVVRHHPDIDFLYLRGNHDGGSGYEGAPMDNLKTFTNKWTTYSYGNVDITGIEMNEGNAVALYSSLSLNPAKNNIVMMHGQVGDQAGMDLICLNRLRGKNINYLALGHVHKGGCEKLDDHGIYVYPGCLEGRGFDETGVHGFYLLNVQEGLGGIQYGFVPFAKRQICEEFVDVSGASDSYTAAQAIRSKVQFVKNNIYRVNMTGEVDFDSTINVQNVENYLRGVCLYVNVKDKTSSKLDLSAFEKDNTLRGEFVREVAASDKMDEETKNAVLRCGLKALNGEDIEF